MDLQWLAIIPILSILMLVLELTIVLLFIIDLLAIFLVKK